MPRKRIYFFNNILVLYSSIRKKTGYLGICTGRLN